MVSRLAACLLLMALSTLPAKARELYRLRAGATACFDLADARQLKDPRYDEGGPSCRRLAAASFTADESARGFLCLHVSKGRCAWISGWIVEATHLDDGVF